MTFNRKVLRQWREKVERFVFLPEEHAYAPYLDALLLSTANYILGTQGSEKTLPPLWLMPTREDFEGTHSFPMHAVSKALGAPPNELASSLGGALLEILDEVESYEVVNGFLNLSLRPTAWLAEAQRLLAEDANVFIRRNTRVMIEFSSPNTNKPLHLGHLRNNFLGESVARILEKVGYDVVRTSLVNDRGIHICKSMLAYQRYGQGETPQSSGIKGDHLVGKYYVLFEKKVKEDETLKPAVEEMLREWEEGDEEVIKLWKEMNGWVYGGFEETYQVMGVRFDKTYYESDTYKDGKQEVFEAYKKGCVYRKEDGSYWVKTPSDEKLLIRKDGTSVYMTQDIGTARRKYEDYRPDISLYVVGDEQNYHFNTLFALLKDWQLPYAKGLRHLSYGMVDLPSGKMKSREGTVVDADQLMADMYELAKQKTQQQGKAEQLSSKEAETLYRTLGLGALKYYLLKVQPKKRMLFDPEASIALEGDTAAFVQYTYARICALRRRAQQERLSQTKTLPKTLGREEQKLLAHLTQYKKHWYLSAQNYDPSNIAKYTYELAKLYNRMYKACPIFSENVTKEVSSFRYLLSDKTGLVIQESLDLLGIQVPERM